MPVCFPFYIISVNDKWTIMYPADKADIGHPEYFKNVVSEVLSDDRGIPYSKIKDLCYSQIRGRYATKRDSKRLSPSQIRRYKRKNVPIPSGDTIYIGENLDDNKFIVDLLNSEFPGVEIKYDDHHKRQEDDVDRFNSLSR
jgi:hypothetical protein